MNKEQKVEQKQEEYRSPVYDVRAVPVEKVFANDYNPNVVAPPEMRLLELSIWEDGFTMPCVCYYEADKDRYIIVDGFHRYRVLKTSKRIYEREKGLLPVVVIQKDISNRMASTIRAGRIVLPPGFHHSGPEGGIYVQCRRVSRGRFVSLQGGHFVKEMCGW